MTDFTLVKDSQGSSLLITLNNGEVLAVPGTHVRFSDVVDYLLETEDDLNEDYIRDLTDIVGQAGTALTSLSDRVKVSGNTLLYDGDPIDSSLSRHILRLVSEGDAVGWKSLVNFLEKVQQNPVEHSRENLYSWIADRDFTLLPNGDLILYKGVSVDDEGRFWSINYRGRRRRLRPDSEPARVRDRDASVEGPGRSGCGVFYRPTWWDVRLRLRLLARWAPHHPGQPGGRGQCPDRL